jgi:hypothetical protein
MEGRQRGFDPEQFFPAAVHRPERSDAATRGVCCTKDIVYREGNIGVWDVLGKNPQELVRLSVGKYDPANSRHVYMLEALGIADQDLADLNDER